MAPTLMMFGGMMLMLLQFTPEETDQSWLVSASRSLRGAFGKPVEEVTPPDMAALLKNLEHIDAGVK